MHSVESHCLASLAALSIRIDIALLLKPTQPAAFVERSLRRPSIVAGSGDLGCWHGARLLLSMRSTPVQAGEYAFSTAAPALAPRIAAYNYKHPPGIESVSAREKRKKSGRKFDMANESEWFYQVASLDRPERNRGPSSTA